MTQLQLIKYNAAVQALAEAKAVDEVKDLRDKAEAMRIYGMQAKNKTLEVDAAEIRIRAERRLGELIAAQKAAGGLNAGTKGQLKGKDEDGFLAVVGHDRQKKAPTLAEVGISKDLSSRAQKLAAVPEEQFEQEVGEWRERVSAENARVSVRLEKSGEAALNQAPVHEYNPNDELQATIDALMEEVERLQRLAAVNWKAAQADVDAQEMADLWDEREKEIRLLQAEIKTLRSTRDELMNSRNEAIRAEKYWRKQAAKAGVKEAIQ